MKKKIESELVKIAHRILNMQGKEDIEDLKREARLAYENLTLLSFLETHLQPSKQVEIRNEIAERFETLAGSVLRGNSNVPETNPHEHEDDLMTPGMQTIRDMVKEMPDPESLEDILAGFGVEPDFVKREKEIITADLEVKEQVQTKMPSPAVETRSKNKGGLNIGLNDKISFIKYLFNGSDEDYARVISQLNTKGSFEEAYSFLNEMIKPDYNNWEGQEIYEARLIKILEARFA